MTKEWLEKETSRRNKEKDIVLNRVLDVFRESGMTDEHVDYLKNYIKELSDKGYCALEAFVMCKIFNMEEMNDKDILSIDVTIRKDLEKYKSLGMHSPEYYLDSDPMEFDGDIIITDPCYIAKDEDWTRFYDDPFMPNCMMRSTIYGDWSCTTFDLNTKKAIGEFCADAGLVGVFLKSEVDKYNPDFEKEYGDRYWCWTHIKDFKGKCWFEVKKNKYGLECEVHGKGINKVTGEPIEFVGEQTGL